MKNKIKVITTTNGRRQKHWINAGGGFTILLHENSIKVDVPGAFLINPVETIRTIDEMRQDQWTHITTGQLFQIVWELWELGIEIPKKVTVAQKDWDEGAKHAAGLIVMVVESIFAEREKVFIKLPETWLHPKQERMVVYVIQAIRGLLAGAKMEDFMWERISKIVVAKGFATKEQIAEARAKNWRSEDGEMAE